MEKQTISDLLKEIYDDDDEIEKQAFCFFLFFHIQIHQSLNC